MKISVIGAGNAGCFTALHCAWHGREHDLEVELIYNPEIKPERVGQATLLDSPRILWSATEFDWYHNSIHATMKSGILYEGWGNINEKIFHSFAADTMAMHYCPWEMQKLILNSGHFKVVESDVLDPSKVDADYVFDCRGKPDDYSNYRDITNPINSCLLGKPKWDVGKNPWSRHVATPDGWTFVIPTHEDSPSHDYCIGYCYNSDITPPDEAEKHFTDQFDVEVKKNLKFKNYVAKNPVIDDRIFLNGNRLFFIDPLESSSTQTYIKWCRYLFDHVFATKEKTVEEASKKVLSYIREVECFVLWHYICGSKYDTPFWRYAQTLTFEDEEFDFFLDYAKKTEWNDVIPYGYGGTTKDECYGQWPPYSFKTWYDGMTRKIK